MVHSQLSIPHHQAGTLRINTVYLCRSQSDSKDSRIVPVRELWIPNIVILVQVSSSLQCIVIGSKYELGPNVKINRVTKLLLKVVNLWDTTQSLPLSLGMIMMVSIIVHIWGWLSSWYWCYLWHWQQWVLCLRCRYQMCTTKWWQAADMHAPRLRSISESYIGARTARIGAPYLHMPIARIWCWWPHNLGLVATMLVGGGKIGRL